MKWRLGTVAVQVALRNRFGDVLSLPAPKIVAALLLEGTAWHVHRSLEADAWYRFDGSRPFVAAASGLAFPAGRKLGDGRALLWFRTLKAGKAFVEGMVAKGYTDPRRQVVTRAAADFAMGVGCHVLEGLPAGSWGRIEPRRFR